MSAEVLSPSRALPATNVIVARQEAGRAPLATYRFQFNRGFNFRQATELVPYLRNLGISHLYASPLFEAAPGSPHGYDTCDFHQLNRWLGTNTEFEGLVAKLHQNGMSLVLDVVPNHMGVSGPWNRWWWDVLTQGQSSPYASYFDISWHSPDPRLDGKILLPVLGDRYPKLLNRGEIRLEFGDQGLLLRYSDHTFPLSPRSVMHLLESTGVHSATENPRSNRLVLTSGLQAAIDQVNKSPDALDKLISQQHYRLCFWRHADTDLNYRRFFSIPALAGLRVEEERVFQDTHRLVESWLDRGLVDGLRIDHPDGLRDPEQYLRRLKSLGPKTWIVVEKILGPGEELPHSWPVAGTTGYEFLKALAGLFIDPASEGALTCFYAEFTGESTDYPSLVAEKKRQILLESFGAELDRLSGLLVLIAARHRKWCDFGRAELRAALVEFIAGFPIYRSYVRPTEGDMAPSDAGAIQTASETARARDHEARQDLYDFFCDLLLLRTRGEQEAEFVARFQQLTGSAMAKGVEDTAFYCFNRFVALNEVGGDPGQFGSTVESFHAACFHRLDTHPTSMLTTSTHDTKRGEDARARLNVLSEIPEQWTGIVRCWSALNESLRSNGWPDRNIEYLFYQTLVGVWPLTVERAYAYMEKAAREAKQHTSWTRINQGYEDALRRFVEGAFDRADFIQSLEDFVGTLLDAGYVNSLAQVLLKLTAPGVPDIYQGAELWDLSLVDPDNRRPVDFQARRLLLSQAANLTASQAWRRRAEGMPKLWLIQRVLSFRRQRRFSYGESGDYVPCSSAGPKADHVIAFVRGGNAVTVVPRFTLALRDGWAGTRIDLPHGQWHNIVTGETSTGGWLPVARLFEEFPVALLARGKD